MKRKIKQVKNEIITFKVPRQVKAKLLKRLRKSDGTLSAMMRRIVCEYVNVPPKAGEIQQGRPVKGFNK